MECPSSPREHLKHCGTNFGRACDCKGAPAYAVEIQKTNAGFGMSTRPRIPQAASQSCARCRADSRCFSAVIADDCQVTKWNGDESAGKAAGVLLNSYIVSVNAKHAPERVRPLQRQTIAHLL